MAKNSNSQVGTILVVLLVVAGLVYFVMMLNNKNVKNQGTLNLTEEETERMVPSPDTNPMMLNVAPSGLESPQGTTAVAPDNAASVNQPQEEGAATLESMSGAREGMNSSCYPKEQLTAKELLPTNESSTWAQVNPDGMGSLKDKNFLQAGHHIGINTVGQTLRNANLQLRSEPANPQVTVSPWMQTTINPDMNRKPFEIGGCA